MKDERRGQVGGKEEKKAKEKRREKATSVNQIAHLQRWAVSNLIYGFSIQTRFIL